MDALDKVVLDWDSASADKAVRMDFAIDQETARKQGVIESYLYIANGGKQFASPVARNVARDSLARERFGGLGVGSDDAFFSEIQKESQARRTHQELSRSLGETASMSELVRSTSEAGLDSMSWELWREEARKKPGFDSRKEAEYYEVWNKTREEVRANLEPIIGPLSESWKALRSGELDLGGAYDRLEQDEREPFLASLALLARSLPAEEQATFWSNLQKAGGRGIVQIGKDTMAAVRDDLRRSAAPEMSVEAERFMRSQAEFGDDLRTVDEKIRDQRNFEDDIERIRSETYDPVRVLNKDNAFLRTLEKGAYAAPGALASTVVAAIPIAGTGLTFGQMERTAYRDMRQNLISGGMEDAAASELAAELSPLVAIPQAALEKVGAGALIGKLPGFERVMQATANRITNSAARFGTRTVAAGIYETGIENVQDFIPQIAQEAAAALSEDVPGVVWKNGKDGFLDGYWENTGATFVAVLPLAVIAGAGGIQQDARVRAYADASDLQLQAFGHSAQSRKNIREAQAKGQFTANAVIEQELARRNPLSEEAKAAVAELEALSKAQQEAIPEGHASGVLPRFYRDGNGWTIYDGETGSTVGTAPNIDEAMRLASAHSTAIDESNAEQTAFLATMLEAGEATAGTAGTAFDFRPGERTTVAQQAARSERDEARVLEQVAAKERLEQAGEYADIVLGSSTTEFKQRVRETVNRINAGGSVLTVFHEESHGFFREALAQGRLTMDETIQTIRALDSVLAAKSAKGASLRFLPDGEVTETQVDEAVAELMESEILRKRKTGTRTVPAGLVSRNLAAMARLAPGAAKKFSRFLNTVREFWGMTFRRASAIKQAIREGTVKEADLDAFTSKLFGLDAQDTYDAQAAQVAADITGDPASSFSLGPSKMADVVAGKAVTKATQPKAKERIFSDIAKRMAKLRELADRTGNAYNFDAFGKPYAPEARFSQEKKDTLNALAVLDGILMAMPPDLRGRVGGFVQLAKLETQEKRLDYLKRRLDTVERVVNDYLKREYGKMLDKLFERAKPKKDQAGKKRVGKAGADIHSLFDTLKAARGWDAAKVEAHVAGLEASIASGDLSAEEEAHAIMEANLVSLIGNWKDADASRRESAVREATSAFDEAYAKFRLEKLLEKEDRQIRRANLEADTGKQGTQAERDAKMLQDNKLKGRWKDVILSLSSFEQVAHYIFGPDSSEANRLVDMERAASSDKEDSIQQKMDALDSLFEGLAGGKYAAEQLRWDMSQKSIKAGGIELSQMEAITATLMWRQEDGRRHMEGPKDENGKPRGPWNYDQDFIDRIEAQLSPEALAVRAHLAGEYAAEYDRINPVYRKLNGVNMPRVANYAPITVKPQQAPAGQMMDPVTGSTMSGTSTTPGSLRNRGNATAQPEFRDALQTYIAHVKQMEHWRAYAPFSAEAGAILRNRELGDSIEAKGGKQGLEVLRSWLDLFAQGGIRDAAAHLEVSQMLGRMSSRAAASALIGRMGVLAVQSTQLGAALAEMPTSAYLKRMGRLFAGQLGWGASLKSDYIQRRINQMPPVVQQAMAGLRSTEPNKLKYAVQKLGRLISGADALFTAGTYAIIHDYQMEQAKEIGLTGQDAEAYANRTAERLTDRVAQPTRPGARSLYENAATNPMVRVSWAFVSEARQKLMLSAWAIAKKPLGDKLRAAAVTWLVGGLGSTLIRAAWRDARNDEDDEWFDEKNWGAKRLALSTLTGPLGGLPVIGDIMEAGAFALAGEYLPEGNLLSGSAPLGRAIRAATRDNWGDDKPDDVMRTVETVLSALAVTNDSIAAASSLSHLARDFWEVIENLAD